MRIVFVVGGFPELSETFILDQMTGLLDRGHDITIFARPPSNPAAGEHATVREYGLMERVRVWDRLRGPRPEATAQAGAPSDALRVDVCDSQADQATPGVIDRKLDPFEDRFETFCFDGRLFLGGKRRAALNSEHRCQFSALAVPDESDFDRVARSIASDHIAQRARIFDGAAVYADDDIFDLQARRFCCGARSDLGDERARSVVEFVELDAFRADRTDRNT